MSLYTTSKKYRDLLRQLNTLSAKEEPRASSMSIFSLQTLNTQRALMQIISTELLQGQKIPAPEYFLIQNLDTFNLRKEHPMYLDYDRHGHYRPTAMPVIAAESTFKRVFLLKPTFSSYVGNHDFLSDEKLSLTRTVIEKYVATKEKKSSSPKRIMKKTSYLHPYFEQHPDILNQLATEANKMTASYHHFNGVRGVIIRSDEMVDHPDYIRFKEYWPLFDWDKLESKFQPIIPVPKNVLL